MQTILEINTLKPIGTKVMIKRGPAETHMGRLGKIEIPAAYRDRNDLKGMLFTGTVIAVGERTNSSKYGHDRDHFEPGDKVYFWHMWDWKDHEVVLKDKESREDYLIVDESDIKAFEIEVGV